MNDSSSFILDDIKYILFDDRDYETSFQFETYVGDRESFIVKDDDGQKYRVTVTKESL